ncbi:MAG TPA: hypothetical protein VNA31_09400, partial [bacterium]|nr:hypothetical protein [bacterium]
MSLRILWVKMGGLWPLTSGGRLRSFHIVSELSHHHRVILLTTHHPADDPHVLGSQLQTCERVISIPHVVPKYGDPRFALALLRSWGSPLPVDVFKFRAPAIAQEVRGLLERK